LKAGSFWHTGGVEQLQQEDILSQLARYTSSERLRGMVRGDGRAIKLDEVADTPEILRAAELLGWPEETEPIGNVVEYENDGEFFHYFIENPNDSDKGLNNFHMFLSAQPARLDEKGVGIGLDEGLDNGSVRIDDYAYGTAPFLIRAHAAFPKLMGATHEAMRSFRTFREAVNYPEVVRAAHMTYRLLPRVMMVDDNERQQYVLGMETPLPDTPILLDAHDRLRR
jgi:hypothetical protein